MASTVKRERQLARERYERQQAKRAAARARKRQRQQIVAVVVAVITVIGGMTFLARMQNNDPATSAASKSSPSPTTPAAASASPTTPSGHEHTCAYAKSPEQATKNVGQPAYDEEAAHEPFTATLKTNQGDVAIAMHADKAPCTTNSFKHLANKGFFDETSCHRLTTMEGLFVLQCGAPAEGGRGGPGYTFGVENAPADGKFPAGTVAMARRGGDLNSNSSQFFVVYKDSVLPPEGGGYSIFGTVTEGLDVVQKVADAGVQGGGSDGPPASKVTIESVQIQEGVK